MINEMNRNLRAKSSTTELAKKVNQKISELTVRAWVDLTLLAPQNLITSQKFYIVGHGVKKYGIEIFLNSHLFFVYIWVPK